MHMLVKLKAFPFTEFTADDTNNFQKNVRSKSVCKNIYHTH